MRGKRSPSDGRLLFFLEEKKQKKINCGAAFLLCSCRFRQRAAQNGRFTYEPSVFLFRAGHAGKHLFTDKSTAPQCLLFLFFKKRNRSPSFLFRRKKRSACTGSAAPQTDGRRHILRCRRSEYHSGYASLLRLVFARVRRACASAFPCKPTTQKKIICGTVTSLRSCRFPQRAAQNGRFVCEPSVFRSEQDTQESIYSQINQLPRNVFCFFSSRKEIVPLLFFLEEKTGRLAREAQALRRTDAGTSCVVVGRNTTAGMPPSSALSLPVSAAPACQLSRANRPRKRKSIAEQLSFCAPAAFADVPHKTDGSHTNRPFFPFQAGHAGKHLFTDK